MPLINLPHYLGNCRMADAQLDLRTRPHKMINRYNRGGFCRLLVVCAAVLVYLASLGLLDCLIGLQLVRFDSGNQQ